MNRAKIKFFSVKGDRLDKAKVAFVKLPQVLPFPFELEYYDDWESLAGSWGAIKPGAASIQKSESGLGAHEVLIFDLESLPGKLSEFVTEVKSRAQATPHFLAMVEASKVDALMAYRSHGFLPPVVLTPYLGSQLVWALAETLPQWFQTAKDKSALDQLESSKKNQSELQAKLQQAEFFSQFVNQVSTWISKLSQATDEASLIESFQSGMLELYSAVEGKTPLQAEVGIFEYLVSIQSFALKWSFPNERKGQNFSLTAAEAQLDLTTEKLFPSELASLGWSEQCQVKFFFHGGLPKYLFIHQFSGKMATLLDSFSEVFQAKLFHLAQKVEPKDVLDPLTLLPLQESYFAALDMELSRAQRLNHPLSLIKLQLDHVLELEQALGKLGFRSVMQQLVKLIQGTGRVNDLYFRTQDYELSLVLPHCSYKGAAIRAERIRTMIEKHSFLNLGQRVTVSQGISTYPTRADSATELDVSASKALDVSIQRGGNRICLSGRKKTNSEEAHPG